MAELPESNIKEIPIRRDPEAAQLEQFDKIAGSLAKMRRRMFEEYIAAGFTTEQALQLCVK